MATPANYQTAYMIRPTEWSDTIIRAQTLAPAKARVRLHAGPFSLCAARYEIRDTRSEMRCARYEIRDIPYPASRIPYLDRIPTASRIPHPVSRIAPEALR